MKLSFEAKDTRNTNFYTKMSLVITLKVTNFMIQRLLVDNENSANIIF